MPVDATWVPSELVLSVCFRIVSQPPEIAYHNYRFIKSNSLLTTGKEIQETRQDIEARAFTGRAMFFFIAGIQPKTVELETLSRMCPKCGLHQAQLKRVDHYLSLFFIPLFPVKRGGLFLECRSCAGVFTESGQPWLEPSPKGPPSCPACGGPMDASFRYCPACGHPVR